MADDYSNNVSTTGRVGIGGTVSGTFEAANDVDWFKVSLTAGRNYEFDVAKAAGFTSGAGVVIDLLNASGIRVAGSTFSTTLNYVPTSSEDAYIAISGFNGGTGPYVITSSPFDDYTGNFSTTGQIQSGGTVTAALEGAGDVDDFAVVLTAGLNYQFTVTPSVSFNTNGGYSPTISLLNGNGVLVAGGGNSTHSITIQPTATGTYFLSATSGVGTGNYVLNESQLDDYAGDFSTKGVLNLGTSIAGTLESSGDNDYFAVTLVAGTTYQFNVVGASTFSGFPGEALIDGSTGVKIAGSSTTKSLSYTPTISGKYYLDVSSSGTGSYVLTSTNTATTPSTSNSVPVYRFFDSKTGTQFLTSSADERNTVIATRPDLVNEGTGLKAAASNDPSASAVYRFFDNVYGTHFFTSNSSERDTIQATRSDLTYEGVGFYEYSNQQASSTPVYRFFDSNRGTHFFTASAS